MAEPTDPDPRCPTCGAAVYAGAEWCNLCFTPIRRPADPEAAPVGGPAAVGAPEPDPTGPAPGEHPAGPAAGEPGPPGSVPGAATVVAAGDEAAGAFWPCPVCEQRNPIALDTCAVCGTPFAAAMRQDRERPSVDPSVAFGRSLLFPGLGHAKLGLGAEGFARGALFLILLFTTLLIGFAGPSSSPLLRIMLLTFAVSTLGVYVLTALEARQIAEGGSPIVSTRLLLWVTVGVLMAAMGLIVVGIGITPTR